MASTISAVAYTLHPHASPSDISPSRAHWTFLLRPSSDASRKPKFSPSMTARKSISPILFDRHDHQLRETTLPAEYDLAESGSDTTSSQPSQATGPLPKIPDQSPILLITLPVHGSHTFLSLKLRLQNLLYSSPTYGSERDWLRTSLNLLTNGKLLDYSFDVEAFVNYAEDNARVIQESRSSLVPHATRSGSLAAFADEASEVPTLDYAAHLRRNAELKAALSPGMSGRKNSHTPSFTSRSSRANSSVSAEKIQTQERGSDSETESRRSCWSFLFTRGSGAPKRVSEEDAEVRGRVYGRLSQ